MKLIIKSRNLIAMCALVLITPETGCAASWPTAQATIRAVEESDRPIPNVTVRVGGGHFSENDPPNGEVVGATDTNGLFVATLASSGELSISAEKRGYYRTFLRQIRLDASQGAFEKTRLTGRWQPFNTDIKVSLKRIVNPTPMYAKSVNLGVPKLGQDVGYDLMAGDWISPFGKGKQADVIFRGELEQRAKDDFEAKLIISFPNQGDGIQSFAAPYLNDGSTLKSSHEAPIDGYHPRWEQTRSRRPGAGEQSNIDIKRNYYLRVKTILDDDGKVKSAHYGKIYGDFPQFRYFLNPDPNMRNVEFDPSNNLLRGLQAFEEVRVP